MRTIGTAWIATGLLAGCSQQVLPTTAPVPALPADSVVASLYFLGEFNYLVQ